ncbi:MAG: hypothetical protein UW68_C0001G0017 [Candidatus Collierbacteria bacterium GW2011_GWB1_44_6]|uniref:Uncharacterized protein n=2 Tax=Candidatus Collieribacteriota TaxID=1752725 RepID=A0A0G1JQL0_9BACT|nr:MAG: hypothetical protein UV68_C0006G0013 [Candidatus Collierbacteria bacterium GW2011_GWC2_43_12]KKT73821.1 MAG: hypothetical protein UW68_C0001G0017 [Candidatus Collierbacteria bacterium GW2011_GWB1_44_6]KKT84060.1 MAG: hypothetical protein UW80_C0002G0013 [Microgenomates group bacterium GW2011_GWC1_44_9]
MIVVCILLMLASLGFFGQELQAFAQLFSLIICILIVLLILAVLIYPLVHSILVFFGVASLGIALI